MAKDLESWWNLLTTLRLLCRTRGIADVVEARIRLFLDDMVPGALAVGSLDGSVCIFKVDRSLGRLMSGDMTRISLSRGVAVHSVVVVQLRSFSGRRAICVGSGDGSVRIFDIAGQLLQQLRIYESTPVYSVQVAEDWHLESAIASILIATCTADETVVVDDESVEPEKAYAHIWRLGPLALACHVAHDLVASCGGHHFGVNGVVLDAERQLLATASDDRYAGLYNFASQRLASCGPHGSFVWEVALDAKLGLLATASEDHSVRMFNLDGLCLATFSCLAGCCEVALDADERMLLASSSDGSVSLWCVDSHQLAGQASIPGMEVHGAAFCPKVGRVIAGASNGEVWEWHVDTFSKRPWSLIAGPCLDLFSAAAVTVALG